MLLKSEIQLDIFIAKFVTGVKGAHISEAESFITLLMPRDVGGGHLSFSGLLGTSIYVKIILSAEFWPDAIGNIHNAMNMLAGGKYPPKHV